MSVSLDPQRLSRLVSLGYEAPVYFGDAVTGDTRAAEKEAWRVFAREAAEAFGCQLALIEHYSPGNPERSFVAAGGLEGFEEVFTDARSRNADDMYLRGMCGRPAGTVHLGTEIVAPEQMRRNATYSMLAMPWHLQHFLMGTILPGGGSETFFALGRTARQTPFVEGDKYLISRLLLSHLTRSMMIHRELAAVTKANAMLAAVIDNAPTGLVIFDAKGKPVLINEKAAAIFAAGDGLAMVNGELRAESGVAQEQLTLALSAMLQTAVGQLVPAPPTVLAARRTSSQPYRVSFSVLGSSGFAGDVPHGSAVVAVIHGERQMSSTTVPALLRATYGLTRAEVSLCEALLAGQALAEAAGVLGISRNTAKTHLTRVFDKTGVRSQIALLRLLTLPGRH